MKKLTTTFQLNPSVPPGSEASPIGCARPSPVCHSTIERAWLEGIRAATGGGLRLTDFTSGDILALAGVPQIYTGPFTAPVLKLGSFALMPDLYNLLRPDIDAAIKRGALMAGIAYRRQDVTPSMPFKGEPKALARLRISCRLPFHREIDACLHRDIDIAEPLPEALFWIRCVRRTGLHHWTGHIVDGRLTIEAIQRIGAISNFYPGPREG